MRGIKTRKFQKRGSGSSKLQKRKRRIFILKVVASFIFVSLIGYGVFSVSRAQTFTISDIQIEGSKLVSKDSILKVANNSLAGAYAIFIPKRNVFLAPREKIEERLKKENPEFVDVEVKTEGLKTMKINVVERVPDALWCAGSIADIIAKKSQCYFADSTGFIFSMAPTYSGNALPTFGGNIEAELELPIGARILSERDFDLYKEFMKNLSMLNITPSFIYIQDNNQYEIITDTGGRILFVGTSDALVLFENLKSIIEEQGDAMKRKEFLNNIDYIDLRYGNKVYYKLK